MGFTDFLGPIGSIISGVAGSLLGNKSRKDDFDRQRDHNLEMWNLQNEYNHPSAQRARLKEAGFNPAMLYGNSSASVSGQAGSIDSAQLSPQQWTSPFANIPDAISQYNDIRVKNAQTDLLRTQVQAADEEMIATRLNNIGKALSNKRSKAEFEEWLGTQQVRFNERSAIYNLNKSRHDMMELDFKMKESLFNHMKKLRPQEFKLMDEKIKALTKSNQWMDIKLAMKESFVDPDAPLMDRLIQTLVEGVFQHYGYNPRGSFNN